MELQLYPAGTGRRATATTSQVGFDELLQELISKGSLDFNTWTSIISKIEKIYPDSIEKICSVYDSFLLEFPLCQGYWRKYAAHKARLCTIDKVVEVFERAVQSATFCVGVWVDYCTFAVSAYEDPSDVRRLFKRAMSFVGKDYLCYHLWNKYIEFEVSQQQWTNLARIYVQNMKFPTKSLHRYYENFKKFVAIADEEMKQHKISIPESEPESVTDRAVRRHEDEVSCLVNDLLDPSTGCFSYKPLQKYKCIGETFYQEACDLERKIHCFETNIRRSYFHVMPLDDNQLQNWHQYLDFVEKQDDFDWAVKLYERCLIPGADYPEFWMRYVEFMEIKGGRELANHALDRATKIFLKNMPVIHLFNARFKELIGDRDGAHAAFLWSDEESSSFFIEKVIKEANMERRLGNYTAASSIYEKALELAAERQKLHSIPILYIHFSRLKYMMTGSVDAAKDVIIDGIQHVPHCKLLLEGLINFVMMHGGREHLNSVDNIIADALFPAPDSFPVEDIREAWNRHIKLFPHLLRTTSMDKCSSAGNQLLDMLVEGRQMNTFPDSYRPSEGHESDHFQLQMQEQRLSLPENHVIHPDQVQLDNSVQETLPQLYHGAAEKPTEDESGVNTSIPNSADQCGDDASGQMESTPYLVHQSRQDADVSMESTHGSIQQSGEDANGPRESSCGLERHPSEEAYGPTESTHDLVHQPREDASTPTKQSHDLLHPVAGGNAILDTPQEYCDSINVQHRQNNEPEQHLKLLSSDGPSLNSQEIDCGISVSTSPFEPKVPISKGIPKNCQNANGSPSLVCPVSTQSVVSAKIQSELVSPSPMEDCQNPPPEPAHPQPQLHIDSAEKWHHMDNTVQASGEDTISSVRGDSQDQQNKKCLVSPQQDCPPAEIDDQMLTGQGSPDHPVSGQDPQVEKGTLAQNKDHVGSAQGNTLSTHSWPAQNLQQQSFLPGHPSQPTSGHASHPQGQMPQYTTQNSDQFGHAHQAYNQMMENYYRHQQLYLQQQYEQQQQFRQQQQHLHPNQQHELYVQQQQSLAQLYHQQSLQLYEQQAQLMQQQLLQAHQQQNQLYHQYMQLQEQNHQEGNQQVQQQHQTTQQQGYHHQQQQMTQQQGYQQLHYHQMTQQQGYQQLQQQQHQLLWQQGYQQVLQQQHQQNQKQQPQEEEITATKQPEVTSTKVPT
ncbi:pre-mRNA-processing factor 39-2 isoform X2 [Diospyros lotus]|uniref:pre-mRNA-processing factor 39-2 isoform X2 n=1 Tax=Diospyros lotus TaxID=55363 RepID=UPI00225C32E7|nr:pre-mRNA-processing factor 39-2 isoform X2 [Diospyros lotus]